MWDPQVPTILKASTACYDDSFALLTLLLNNNNNNSALKFPETVEMRHNLPDLQDKAYVEAACSECDSRSE
jgi:hypothetical protein